MATRLVPAAQRLEVYEELRPLLDFTQTTGSAVLVRFQVALAVACSQEAQESSPFKII